MCELTPVALAPYILALLVTVSRAVPSYNAALQAPFTDTGSANKTNISVVQVARYDQTEEITGFGQDADFDFIFSAAELTELRKLDAATRINFKAMKRIRREMRAPTSVFFLKANDWGTALVRADEVVYILRELIKVDFTVGSLECNTYCGQIHAASRRDVLVHVKVPCECALKAGARVHIYDPVDHFSEHSMPFVQVLPSTNACPATQNMTAQGNCFSVYLTGTSLMTDQLKHYATLQNFDVDVVRIGHHHSNFHDRRHEIDEHSNMSSASITVGFAGDYKCYVDAEYCDFIKLFDNLDKCLKAKGFTNSHVVKVQDIAVDVKGLLGPSLRGDGYAMKLKAFDIGVVWPDFMKCNQDACLKDKPSQRLVNILSVGIPTIAFAGLESHKDLVADTAWSERHLAKDERELCDKTSDFIRSLQLRQAAFKEAVLVSSHFSPSSIGSKYLSLFRRWL